MDRSFLLVGVGGFVGSFCRYFLAVFVARQLSTSFPFGTLAVNIIGCFLIGIIFALSERGTAVSPEVRILLTTGFCGGFTTFSTFSYESIRLMQDGELLYVAVNVALSVIVGFASTYIGILIIEWL